MRYLGLITFTALLVALTVAFVAADLYVRGMPA